MTKDVPLRYTRRAQAWLLVPMALTLVLCPVSGLISVGSGEDTFLVGVLIGLGVWTFIWTISVVQGRGTWYRLRGGTLIVRGLMWKRIHLPTAKRVAPALWSPRTRGKRIQFLVIYIGSVRIKLGDPRVRCYYRPEGLRALAQGLEHSSRPDVRDNGRWLRELADKPDLSSWPRQPG